MQNRHGYTVEVAPITKVDMYDDGGCAITRGEPGWGTFGLGAEELDGFVPQEGDISIVYTRGFSMIMGVVIDGRVLRYKTPEQAEAEAEQRRQTWRLEKLERYIKHGAELKRRAEALPLPLRKRMARFAAEGGEEFWIESAGYEMAALEGAAALLRKVVELKFVNNVDGRVTADDVHGAVQWIQDWWDINSDKHDPPYDYKKQMEIVPDFGDDHSGNTAGAAKAMAQAVLRGQRV